VVKLAGDATKTMARKQRATLDKFENPPTTPNTLETFH
jgi:hypothetical protein